jgi:N-acyl-D-amino-acid deacylase
MLTRRQDRYYMWTRTARRISALDLSRRTFQMVATAAILLLTEARAQPTDTPRGFEQIESAFLSFMQANNVPGASLAIARNGRLVLVRGYGFADVDQREPMQPESLLRFGSIGKTITSIAIMKLVESGKLDLDTSAFALLPEIRPRSGRLADVRIGRITIRNLLTHSGGWDAAFSGDPVTAPFSQQIASAMGVAFPPSPTAIISYMLDRRLDFDPGARFAYSNFGFLILGRVIEKLSGQSYAEFVRLQVLATLGIERMRQGRTPLALRAPGEVHYYDYPGAPLVDSLMPGVRGKVPEPYSGIVAFESADSAGGWIASAIDLVRIFVMLDGWGAPAVLTRESVQQMVTPVFPAPSSTGQMVGLGIGSMGPDGLWAHGGGTFGTASFACRPRHGWAWAAIFNSAPRSFLYDTPGADFLGDLQHIMSVESLESVSWSEGDLFAQYLPSGRPAVAPGGVVNVASAQAGPIVPGELITIYGTYLGPPNGVSPPLSADGVLPDAYTGTSVSVNGVAAPLLFVSGSQINAVVPFNIDSSTPAELQVRAFGYESEPLSLPAGLAAPALFSADGSGNGQVAALNPDGTLNSVMNPATAASIVSVFGTGFGQTVPFSRDGELTGSNPSVLSLLVKAAVGGKEAKVTYAGSAPGLVAGVSQVNFQIPSGLEPGVSTVVVSAGEFSSAAGVTIAVK